MTLIDRETLSRDPRYYRALADEYERQNSISLEKSPWDVRNSITLSDYRAIPAHIAADALAKGGRK